jgi:hypothetical protein
MLALIEEGRGMSLAGWFYRGGRPNRVARLLDRGGAMVYALGVAPNYMVTLEVPGRRTGRIFRLPLVMVVFDGERYLVSMLGEDVNWVRNVKAAGGKVTLLHGRREEVRLEEVAPEYRAPVLKDYLKRAPGTPGLTCQSTKTRRSPSSSGCRPGSPCSGWCRAKRREYAGIELCRPRWFALR